MLKLENVSFSYQDKKVLDNFSLEIKDGECICLKGDSGCGKTTVARLLLGLEKAQEGIVTAPKKISCVFQEDRLLDHLTVLKNIFLVIPKKREKLVLELATELGLQDSLKLKISELSGGMKRRVAIIKAIAFSGDALILDEAFNGLLSSLLFGSAISLVFSLSAGLVSLGAVCIFRKIKALSPVGISAVSAVVHNLVQMAVACTITGVGAVYYLPVLLLSGLASGIAVGIISRIILKKVKTNGNK